MVRARVNIGGGRKKHPHLIVKKILVAVDGSEACIRAVRLAATIAKGMDAEIVLLHVTEIQELPTLMSEFEDPISEERGQMILGDAAKIVRLEGPEPKIILRKGHVVDQILRFVKEYRPDLIVMGSRGLSNIKGMILNSVSQKVSVEGKCSVLLMK
jgi:nucleotide-binding universal stress UspA family protein